MALQERRGLDAGRAGAADLTAGAGELGGASEVASSVVTASVVLR